MKTAKGPSFLRCRKKKEVRSMFSFDATKSCSHLPPSARRPTSAAMAKKGIRRHKRLRKSFIVLAEREECGDVETMSFGLECKL